MLLDVKSINSIVIASVILQIAVYPFLPAALDRLQSRAPIPAPQNAVKTEQPPAPGAAPPVSGSAPSPQSAAAANGLAPAGPPRDSNPAPAPVAPPEIPFGRGGGEIARAAPVAPFPNFRVAPAPSRPPPRPAPSFRRPTPAREAVLLRRLSDEAPRARRPREGFDGPPRRDLPPSFDAPPFFFPRAFPRRWEQAPDFGPGPEGRRPRRFRDDRPFDGWERPQGRRWVPRRDRW